MLGIIHPSPTSQTYNSWRRDKYFPISPSFFYNHSYNSILTQNTYTQLTAGLMVAVFSKWSDWQRREKEEKSKKKKKARESALFFELGLHCLAYSSSKCFYCINAVTGVVEEDKDERKDEKSDRKRNHSLTIPLKDSQNAFPLHLYSWVTREEWFHFTHTPPPLFPSLSKCFSIWQKLREEHQNQSVAFSSLLSEEISKSRIKEMRQKPPTRWREL